MIVAGPGPTNEEFVNQNYLEYRLQDMIIGTIDASYSGAEGVREAYTKSTDILSNFRMVEEKLMVDKLFKQINSHSGLGVYGLADIIGYLKNNVVDMVIVTDNIELGRIEVKCNKCSHIDDKIVEQRNGYRHYINPVINVNKKWEAEAYKDKNLLDSLFPLTYSCEGSIEDTKYHTQHCKRCWWCQERFWAFGRYV